MILQKVLRKVRREDKQMRILILGLDNAGKTTIVRRFNNEEISTVAPTLGFKISTLIYEPYLLNIWDVGGQRSLRSYWKNYFESTDGLIWVVDSADIIKLEQCALELAGLLQEERLAGASLLVLANKQDLQGALNEDQIKTALSLDKIKTHNWALYTVSAVASPDLTEPLRWLVEDIASRMSTKSR